MTQARSGEVVGPLGMPHRLCRPGAPGFSRQRIASGFPCPSSRHRFVDRVPGVQIGRRQTSRPRASHPWSSSVAPRHDLRSPKIQVRRDEAASPCTRHDARVFRADALFCGPCRSRRRTSRYPRQSHRSIGIYKTVKRQKEQETPPEQEGVVDEPRESGDEETTRKARRRFSWASSVTSRLGSLPRLTSAMRIARFGFSSK